MSAQRRPGLSPRRHLRQLRKPRQQPHRSTKAGALTPATLAQHGPPCVEAAGKLAQRRPGLSPRRHHHYVPAWSGVPLASPLNEGRGSHPGDTSSTSSRTGQSGHMHRSTKAGALTPATLASSHRGSGTSPSVRSTKAGALTPATHDNDYLAVAMTRFERSTKAGALTPATRPPGVGAHANMLLMVAQRRPGLSPRRHVGAST